MKKTKRFIVPLLAPTFLLGCGCSQSGATLSRESEAELSSVATKKISDLTEAEYKDIPSYFATNLMDYQSYKAITKGNTVATFLFITVDQSIDVTTIKGKEYSYMMNESHSNLVNSAHQAYYHGENALVKDNWASAFASYDKAAYLEKYGVDPFGYSIEGYSLQDEAIKSVTKEEGATDYKFKIEFDPEKATNNIKIQMRQFGSLDDYPSFSYCAVSLNIKDDFTPINVEIDAYYKAKKTMTTDCHQTYTVTYSDINADPEIPEIEQVKAENSF